jgi:hypothetical protein
MQIDRRTDMAKLIIAFRMRKRLIRCYVSEYHVCQVALDKVQSWDRVNMVINSEVPHLSDCSLRMEGLCSVEFLVILEKFEKRGSNFEHSCSIFQTYVWNSLIAYWSSVHVNSRCAHRSVLCLSRHQRQLIVGDRPDKEASPFLRQPHAN